MNLNYLLKEYRIFVSISDELFEANFPRRVPLELFSDDALKRLDLLEEKNNKEKKEETTSKNGRFYMQHRLTIIEINCDFGWFENISRYFIHCR